jgi:signal transduction histidine kinase
LDGLHPQLPYLFYCRLVGFTAGALVYLFLIALVVGHRRPRRLERLLFFLLLALFLIYAGGLLALNAEMHYGSPPTATQLFSSSLMTLGLLFLVPLLLHTHWEYLRQLRPALSSRGSVQFLYSFLYAFVAAAVIRVLYVEFHAVPGGPLARIPWTPRFQIVLMPVVLVCAGLQLGIARAAQEAYERRMFQWLSAISAASFMLLALWTAMGTGTAGLAEGVPLAVVICGILPGAVLIHYSLGHEFLEFGAQSNLVFALSATFVALLYLALVRRISGWLEPVLPPEATASILLFVLLFLFEPLERAIGPALHRRFRARVDRLQRMTAEMHEVARQGDLERLVAFSTQRVQQEFALAEVRISVPAAPQQPPLISPGRLGHVFRASVEQDGRQLGTLEASSTGAVLTGETSAGLEFVAEQFPGMIALCRLIGERVDLERELAERQRLALLGQMTATISHNLRNPLSAMKTILQVQLENRNLDPAIRRDTELVLAETERLAQKLNELLRYAKPAVVSPPLLATNYPALQLRTPEDPSTFSGPTAGESFDAATAAAQVIALLARDSQARTVNLEFVPPPRAEELRISGGEESFREILSNLIENAVEAQPRGGIVRVEIHRSAANLVLQVTDRGPGIPADLRAKIFQPFFTTKASGTGLGLAIVAKRLEELAGSIECITPAENGSGARFTVTLPLAGN